MDLKVQPNEHEKEDKRKPQTLCRKIKISVQKDHKWQITRQAQQYHHLIGIDNRPWYRLDIQRGVIV